MRSFLTSSGQPTESCGWTPARVRVAHNDGVSGEALITLVALGAMVAALATRRLSPAVSVLGALAVLFLTGVLSTQEAFAGFSNPAPITIAGLYVVAAAVSRTGALESVFARILPRSSSNVRAATARIAASAGLGSAFVANTPIVALAIPRIRKWAADCQLPASKFLIPLSYAAMLGGTLTVIGTSTNLIVSGLMVDAGMDPFGFFEMARIGLPVFLVGIVLIIRVGAHRHARTPAGAASRPRRQALQRLDDRGCRPDHSDRSLGRAGGPAQPQRGLPSRGRTTRAANNADRTRVRARSQKTAWSSPAPSTRSSICSRCRGCNHQNVSTWR